MPLGLRSHGSSGRGSTWADSLVVGSDGPERPLDDTCDALVKQEQLFEATFQDVDTVLEVGLATRPAAGDGARVPVGWRSRRGEVGSALISVSARLANSRFMVTRTKWAKSSCLTPRSVLA